MATDHVKVYEDGKKGGMPFWAWLLPLLVILALLIWFFTRHHATAGTAATAAPAVATAGAAGAGMPDLGSVHFDTDQATLTPNDQAELTRAADYLKQHPDAHMRVEGYTDATGTDPHNVSLSDRRAAAVVGFLTAQGIDRSRLTGQGFGPENPVAPNTTSDGKADNRRVELFQQQ